MKMARRLLAMMAITAATLGTAPAIAMAAPRPASVTASAQVRAGATATVLRPATDESCTWSSGNDIYFCFQIVGGGLYVDSMNAYVVNISGASTSYFVDVVGPGGFVAEGPSTYIAAGDGEVFTWPIDADLAAGTYKAGLFEWSAVAGEWFLIATTTCVVES